MHSALLLWKRARQVDLLNSGCSVCLFLCVEDRNEQQVSYFYVLVDVCIVTLPLSGLLPNYPSTQPLPSVNAQLVPVLKLSHAEEEEGESCLLFCCAPPLLVCIELLLSPSSFLASSRQFPHLFIT